MCKQWADQHLNLYGILIDKILVEELMAVNNGAKKCQHREINNLEDTCFQN